MALICLYSPKVYILVFHPDKNVRKLTMNSTVYRRSANAPTGGVAGGSASGCSRAPGPGISGAACSTGTAERSSVEGGGGGGDGTGIRGTTTVLNGSQRQSPTAAAATNLTPPPLSPADTVTGVNNANETCCGSAVVAEQFSLTETVRQRHNATQLTSTSTFEGSPKLRCFSSSNSEIAKCGKFFFF